MPRGLVAVVLLLAAAPTAAAEPDYLRDIKPLLKTKCYACHGAVRQRAGLRLDAGQLVLKGGKRGEVIEPGKPEKSLLLRMIAPHGQERAEMPPEGEGEALTEKEIALFRDWIKRGARAPVEPVPEGPRSHWAYQPPRKAKVPGPGNPVDAFLSAARAKHGVSTNPEADRSTLLRRVYLDLIGIPPTPAELRAFLCDSSADAYEKVVDRLLASPQYGERWGRHWMDVWRYSDPFGNGDEYRYSQRHIWRWRDWIVESLNADKGYDRMILEMLAGDEIAPRDRDTLRATGYLARNWYKFNRNAWIQDSVEYTAAGFLGITMRCARCHDHKYDPISQADYYRFRAFFEPHDVRIDAVPGQPDTNKDGVARAFDKSLDAPTYLLIRGDERTPDRSRALEPGVPRVFGQDIPLEPIEVGLAAESVASVTSSAIVPRLLPATSTGRRLALAEWITEATNPLTARVAVNHIWMRHFGTPLVPTVANFGLNGKPPAHPELLDWLAVEFVQSNWSMKHLHRLIVTSRAYRLSSRNVDGPNKIADSENRLYWRANSRRMDAEVVRDSLLAIAGQLDTTLGGPTIDEKLGLTSKRRSLYFRFNAEYKMSFLDQFDAASPTECYERRESVVPQQALALHNSVLALNVSREIAGQLAKLADNRSFVAAAFERVLNRAPSEEERTRCEEFLREQITLYSHPDKLTPFPAGPAVKAPSTIPAQRAREDLVHVLLNHNDFVTVR
jgi:hypothetical protein